jgi:ABC-2 type transport system ATP-binding protein
MNAIETRNVTRVYHTFEKEEGLKGSLKALFKKKRLTKSAVNDFTFQVEEGEFIGLIGPNGAGKTTLIKMLTGVIHPTSGTVSVLGYTPCELKDAFKKNYAVVMGQKSQLWWDLPAVDSFGLNREIYQIPDVLYRKNLNYFTELFGVEKLLNIQVRNLSLGERMKMELISSLLHNPKVLFLDEPTIGLDAVAQKQVRQFLKEINEQRGVTILLTSHYMEDIRHLCRRTIVINQGGKIYDGPLQQLLDSHKEYKTISVSFTSNTKVLLEQEVEWLESSPFKVVVKVQKELVRPVLQEIMARYEVDDIAIEEEEIGNVVEKIYKAGQVAV